MLLLTLRQHFRFLVFLKCIISYCISSFSLLKTLFIPHVIAPTCLSIKALRRLYLTPVCLQALCEERLSSCHTHNNTQGKPVEPRLTRLTTLIPTPGVFNPFNHIHKYVFTVFKICFVSMKGEGQ